MSLIAFVLNGFFKKKVEREYYGAIYAQCTIIENTKTLLYTIMKILSYDFGFRQSDTL